VELSSPWLENGVYKSFHKGKFQSSAATSFHSVYNPATNEEVGKVPDTTKAEFEDVMTTAQAAFEDWKTVPVHQRQRVMLEYQRLLREHLTDLAGLITLENGKTLADAKGDVIRGLEVVETACQVAPHMLGDSLAGISSNMDCTSYREPLGVCAGVGEFES
jgi:malonate-semialdehyde dehydrogenase (acetylating)/methylmalonate-semialdehyde dehydrogenase